VSNSSLVSFPLWGPDSQTLILLAVPFGTDDHIFVVQNAYF
jgi:hypothetical protein